MGKTRETAACPEMDQLFDAVLCGILRYTPGPEPELLNCNKNCAEIYGYRTPEALIDAVRQLGPERLVYRYDRQFCRGQEEKCLARDRTVNFGFRILRRDSALTYVLGTMTPFHLPDGQVVIQCIFNDAGSRVSAQSKVWQQYLQNSQTEGTKPMVLLMDMEDRRCREAARLLEGHFRVLTATSRTAFITALQQSHGSLSAVLVEAGAAAEQGYSLISLLKRCSTFSDLPLLALRLDEAVSCEALMELGVSSILDLPCSPRTLQLQVQNLVNLHALAVHDRAINALERTMPGGLILVRFDDKLDSELLYASDAVTALTGYSKEACDRLFYRKNALRALIHQHDLPRIQMRLATTLSGGTPVESACRLVRKDGSEIWVYLRAVRLREEQGTVMQITITPSTEGECNYRRTLDDAFCGILVNDRSTGELLYENNEAARLGKDCSAELWRIFQEGEVTEDRFASRQISRPDDHISLAVSARLVDWNGMPAQVTYLVDNTAEVQKQQELHRIYKQEMSHHDTPDARSIGTAIYNLTQEKMERLDLRGAPVPDIHRFDDLDNLISSGLLKVIKPAHRKLLHDTFSIENLRASFQQGKRRLSIQVQASQPDGSLRWIEGRINLVEIPDTHEKLAFLYINDVDEAVIGQKVQHTALMRELEYVMCFDPHNGMVRFISRDESVLDFFDSKDLPLDAFRERAAQLVMPGQDQEAYLHFWQAETLRQALDKAPVHTLIYRLRTDEDHFRWKKLQAFYLDGERDLICFVRRDVNELHQAQEAQEAQLKQALEAANRANQAKSDFLSRMSHDIRTPMNAVLGLCQLALSQFDDRELVRDHLKRIQGSGEYLLSLINDILDMSKIEHGKVMLTPEPVDIGDCVAFVRNTMQVKLEEHRLRFLYRETGLDGLLFMLDKNHFRQIIFNLLSNAVKFTPDGGQVEVDVRLLAHSGGTAHVAISVADSGIGVAPEMRERIFLPFERGRDAHTLTQEGTGLGLAIVRNLVDLMGGSIRVENRPEGGADFILEFRLPVARQQPSEAEEQAESYDFTGAHILLAEDHPINAEIAKSMLELVHCSVELATDGAQALARFCEAPERYDAVLMDLRMPVMDGLEATRRIRASNLPRATDIPIIAMTADAFLQSVSQVNEAGMSGYLSKPLLKEQMYQVLHRAIHQKGV